ncbi:MAG: enoyl-CoA hydratase/isomerase family protein [Pseudomonadales bacterium]|nr:enoyl-CoA hydratase/isomerase family protein [Pseudomonadales bacterium]MBO6563744.1 enoyl-CoA hydratase/isomerase family protein [Pseudomonadales bacterium]MBO6596823.1 enoyl-CoA hydratase/isomerase family protein [Pseudomonadales bacterium]MBO6658920.1 enoyl-CoA hydratase/isomerase family protein [Pseudomonadales bacterium]MBO6823188.1 enoyl-CoA hydratase/isomerase family protein [Pseudomonadales bacterium]
MSYETLNFDIADGIATITLNRPDAANALNLTMAKELSDVAIVCDESSDVRVVVIRGNGKMFCAGGDLSIMGDAGPGAAAVVKQMAGDLHMGISRLTRMNAPVIAAVNGTAAGAGFSLAVAADLVVSVDTARYTMAYTAAGLSPDGSSTFFLPRRVGDRRARELMLTNRMLSAAEALEWGLINQVVSEAELDETVQKLADSLADGPTLAFGQVKSLLNASFDNGLETQMELESRGIADMARSRDGQEGINAFLNKRKPEFTGE